MTQETISRLPWMLTYAGLVILAVFAVCIIVGGERTG